MRKSMGVGAAIVLAALLSTQARAQDALPPWAIKFSHKTLDAITVPYKDGAAVTYYYMLFTLENKGAVDAPLGLHFKAVVGSNPRKQKVHRALPNGDAEEFVRRMSRSPGLKNVQQINKMKTLKKGQSVKGIAVFGTFNREWDIAIVTVSGLEPHGLACRVRKYEGAGFTLAHRAYTRHNNEVLKKAGPGAEFTEANVVLKHDVIWRMKFHREGDEYSPQMDPIHLDMEEWDVVRKPAPSIVLTHEEPFKRQ